MRLENATNGYENMELVAKRQGELEDEGGFRTLLQKEGAVGRAGVPTCFGRATGGKGIRWHGLRHSRREARYEEGVVCARGQVAFWRCLGGVCGSRPQAPRGYATIYGETRAVDTRMRPTAVVGCGQTSPYGVDGSKRHSMFKGCPGSPLV